MADKLSEVRLVTAYNDLRDATDAFFKARESHMRARLEGVPLDDPGSRRS